MMGLGLPLCIVDWEGRSRDGLRWWKCSWRGVLEGVCCESIAIYGVGCYDSTPDTNNVYVSPFVLKEGRRHCVTPEPQPHYSRTGNEIAEI